MKFTIETAKVQQLPAIADLATEIWNEHYLGIISQPQIDYMLGKDYNLDALQKDVDLGTIFLIATQKKQPIGFAAFKSLSSETLKLEKLYLLNAYQGQGIGAALLKQVETVALARGARDIILFVNKHNRMAISAYCRAGYVHFDSVLESIGEGFFVDDFILRKTLGLSH